MRNKINSKKSFIIIESIHIILFTLLGGCMKKEPTVVEDKQKIVYGDDLTNQTFTINHEGEEIKGNLTDLNPEKEKILFMTILIIILCVFTVNYQTHLMKEWKE